jgi:hypothetical protein
MYFAGPLFTILTNDDPIFLGRASLPGLRIQEVVPLLFGHLALLGPFLLARSFLHTLDHLSELLWAVVLGTMLYSLPMLLEVRLSPQLNIWIYGFFQHSFEQMARGGGFRPIVFLYHGLWAAFLVTMAVLSTVTLIRSTGKRRRGPMLVAFAIWLTIVLILCKSMASLVYTIVFAPLILVTKTRTQVSLAGLIALLALSYPIARGAGLVPVDTILASVEQIAPDRAASLRFRFANEEILLDRARERPVFGWGIWGRNHIHDAFGNITSVTDGLWIIIFGALGWVGYLSQFGLLVLPVFLVWLRRNVVLPPVVAGMSLILTINVVDLIPNATATPLTWLLAGSLLAWVERSTAQVSVNTPGAPMSGARLPVLLGAGRLAPRPEIKVLIGADSERTGLKASVILNRSRSPNSPPRPKSEDPSRKPAFKTIM